MTWCLLLSLPLHSQQSPAGEEHSVLPPSGRLAFVFYFTIIVKKNFYVTFRSK